MIDGKVFDEDYFINGLKSGKSLYSDYKWLPNLTIPMAQSIIEHCGIYSGNSVLDFGCARGYLVKALCGLGYDVWGVDLSDWAIKNADEETKPFLSLSPAGPVFLDRDFEWIIAKDVLEHIEYVNDSIKYLMSRATIGMFVVVPLSKFDKGRYVVEEYEKDITHIQRYRLATWVEMFLRPGWRVEASYRVPGVKDNYSQYPMGNGFITARRIKD